MPVAAFVLASAGTLSNNAAETKSSLAPVQGWKRIAAFNCVQKRECNNLETIVCKDGIDNMYSKPTSDSDCTQLLTHKP